MADGPALTIGEVINLLKDEFPDVTVSKVRFLESQGLIDPAPGLAIDSSTHQR